MNGTILRDTYTVIKQDFAMSAYAPSFGINCIKDLDERLKASMGILAIRQ